MQQATNFDKKPYLAGMAKEYAQNAYVTKAGNDLQIAPQDQDDSDEQNSNEGDGDDMPKKKKKEKKRKRGDKYSKYAMKESKEKNIDMRDLYTEDPSK